MNKFDNSIDSQIFMALTISQDCDIPILILGNSGCGKSTVIKEFCDINGYESVLLRISNETPDTLTGFPTVGGERQEGSRAVAAQHIRPVWFQTILDNKAKGKTSVLFLDEITTSNVMVQGAALNLVFDRLCAGEKLPDDTLIVAAGNYFGNLSNENTMLPPMLNRFDIVNVVPTERDLDTFLCEFDGARTGKRSYMQDELTAIWKEMQEKKKKDLTQGYLDSVGEIIETAIRMESHQLYKEGKLDLSISDYQDIYTTQTNDQRLPNFISLRSLNYLKKVAMSCYICFGTEGLNSTNFWNMIHGLVGIAMSRNKDNGEDVEKNIVTDRYYEALCRAGQEIERLNNDKLPKYTEFFDKSVDDLKKNGVFDIGDLAALRNKIEEMHNDKSVSDIERPMAPATAEKIYIGLIETFSKSVMKYYSNLVSQAGVEDSIVALSAHVNPEEYISHVEIWNKVADVASSINKLFKDSRLGYDLNMTRDISKHSERLSKLSYKLRMIKRTKKDTDTAFYNMIPEVNLIEGLK